MGKVLPLSNETKKEAKIIVSGDFVYKMENGEIVSKNSLTSQTDTARFEEARQIVKDRENTIYWDLDKIMS